MSCGVTVPVIGPQWLPEVGGKLYANAEAALGYSIQDSDGGGSGTTWTLYGPAHPSFGPFRLATGFASKAAADEGREKLQSALAGTVGASNVFVKGYDEIATRSFKAAEYMHVQGVPGDYQVYVGNMQVAVGIDTEAEAIAQLDALAQAAGVLDVAAIVQ